MKAKVVTPKFSLIMPTMNRPGMILEAIAALRAQDFQDWELIVEDGGDSVESILPADPRIKYMRQEDPLDKRGNAALMAAQGDILNFHSDDDTLRPGALSHVAGSIGNHKWMYGLIKAVPYGWTMGGPWDYERLKRENFIPAPAVFWTRNARDQVGGWDLASPRAHDWDYWLRLGARWEPLVTRHILVNYRIHPESATSTMTKEFTDEQDEIIRERARSGYYKV